MKKRESVLLDAATVALFEIGRNASVRAGIDRVELEEFARILSTGGDDFLATVYSDDERRHCRGRVDQLAARFAAKEAASKALGVGLRGVGPREIEVFSEGNGQPHLRLHGRAHDRAQALGISSLSVSLTHTSITAEAFVIALVSDESTTDSALRKEDTR